MATSSLTVKGLVPSLLVLGNYQRFIFDKSDPVVSFQLDDMFIPTAEISSQKNSETRNYMLSGFRWVHTTNNTDTIGSYKLQSFVNAESTGIDIMSFNQDGTVNFLAPVTFSAGGGGGETGLVMLIGDVIGSGPLGSSITTTLKENPVFYGFGSITVPVGNTSQRPLNPSRGMIRYNTDI
jgi:hypothetical protein